MFIYSNNQVELLIIDFKAFILSISLKISVFLLRFQFIF